MRLTFSVLLAVLAILASPRMEAAELLVTDRVTNRILAYPYDTSTGTATGGAARVLVENDILLNEPTAMVIGPGGNLLVASRSTGRIHQYDIATGAAIGADSVFIEPSDPSLGGAAGLAYNASTNRLYVSMFGSPFAPNLVQAYDATTGAHIFAEDIALGPNGWRTGLAIDAAGNLYANNFSNEGFSGSGESGAVLQFPAGNLNGASTTLIEGNDATFDQFDPAGQVIYIDGLQGLAVDGSGNVYTASLFGQQVLKFNISDPSAISVIGSSPLDTSIGLPDAPPYMAYPSGVLIDADGNLLVSTLGNDRDDPLDPDRIYGPFRFYGNVQKFAPDGTFLGLLDLPIDALNQSPAFESFQPTSMLISPVPEPSTVALLGIGGFWLIRRVWRRKAH